jgi:hypothetical protein
MAESFGFGPVHDTDRPLKARPTHLRWRVTQVEEEARNPYRVKEHFVAVGERTLHLWPVWRPIPVHGGCDGARARCEADQNCRRGVALANELPNIERACLAHLCCPRVAQVRVMGLDHQTGRLAAAAQMRRKRVQRIRHVSVAHVPRRDATLDRRR